jgi:hypothetical protein
MAQFKESTMPLLDHFRAPLFPRYPWESFHTFWAVSIAERLNALLPQRYLATVQTHLGSQIEADVAEGEGLSGGEDEPADGQAGGVAVQPWAPPVATLVMPAVFPDDFEVHVRDRLEDARLVAAVELVSPRNKDRPESRRAFAAKCAVYLQRGIGLATVDIVTTRQFNLHNAMIEVMGWSAEFAMPAESALYAAAYRPARRQEKNEIDVWPVALALGESLPLLPLALKGTRAVPLDLEAAYSDARQRSRL